MDSLLGGHLPLPEREQYLRDNCDEIEMMSYMKRFTPEEIEAMKNRLSTVSIEANDIEEEQKDVAQQYKAKLKPLGIEKKELLTHIKQKAISVKEDCFKILDHTSGRVGYYNYVGELIEERPMLPNERQKSIFNIRTGS